MLHPDSVGTPCTRLAGGEWGGLKVARTLADLATSTPIRPKHLQEAVQYRTPDRNLWV